MTQTKIDFKRAAKAARSRKYYRENKDAMLAAMRESYQNNRDARLARARAYRDKNRDKVREYGRNYRAQNLEFFKDKRLKAAYGIGLEEVRIMLHNQQHKCAICKTAINESDRHIDHCHASGKVRALLCGSCNVMIGYAKESKEILEAAIAYLEAHNVSA